MNITTAFGERSFLIPRADFVSDSQIEIIRLILLKHGEKNPKLIKLIDENDDYDSFLINCVHRSFCLKMSFDKIPIFYEFSILKGIEHLQIAPQAATRGEIEFGETIYYTFTTFEYSDNLNFIGISSIADSENINFDRSLSTMHSFEPPNEVHQYLDDTESFLQYQKISFESILKYIDDSEKDLFNFVKFIYNEIHLEMNEIFFKNKILIDSNKLVHGNLNSSTIISNSSIYKFVNFENSFIGNPMFDLCSICLELGSSGMKEYDFVKKRIDSMKQKNNNSYSMNEYKICKSIWIRKKCLDILKCYIKEIFILNKQRPEKITKMGKDFSINFYKFNEIPIFNEHKDIFIREFNNLILNN